VRCTDDDKKKLRDDGKGRRGVWKGSGGGGGGYPNALSLKGT